MHELNNWVNPINAVNGFSSLETKLNRNPYYCLTALRIRLLLLIKIELSKCPRNNDLHETKYVHTIHFLPIDLLINMMNYFRAAAI